MLFRSSSGLRTATHVHSDWSDDGSWPLEQISKVFGRHGYQLVLMCEHSRGFSPAKWTEYVTACREVSDEHITLIPGIEYGDSDNVVHIPVWGDVPFFGDGLQIGRLLAQVTESGGTAVWAHPWRRDAWRRADSSWYSHLVAVEVWNRKYDGIAPNRNAITLANREQLTKFVALDFHTRRQLFPLSLSLRLGEERAQRSDGLVEPHDVYSALGRNDFDVQALGLPLDSVTSGAFGRALDTAESIRRAIRGARARVRRPGIGRVSTLEHSDPRPGGLLP